MISIETDARIIRIILNIANREKHIEQLRQELSQQSQFVPYSAFQRIDRGFTGYITTEALYTFLKYYII